MIPVVSFRHHIRVCLGNLETEHRLPVGFVLGMKRRERFGFLCALRALPSCKASRPFDQIRNGFVMAEVATVLILKTLAHMRPLSATILAKLVGTNIPCGACCWSRRFEGEDSFSSCPGLATSHFSLVVA